jgi:hypothetical protein
MAMIGLDLLNGSEGMAGGVGVEVRLRDRFGRGRIEQMDGAGISPPVTRPKAHPPPI